MSANNAEPRKLGLNQVFPDPSDDPGTTNIDIIAIHGLDTQSPKAWVAWKKDGDPTSGEVHWLRDENMLPSVIPNARIFTYDWNANFDRNPATDILLGHADGLLDRLHIRRSKDRSDRPIIFIASCFGGLLLVKSLHRAREVPEYQGILRSTVGVAFLGTPFRGSHESFYSATQLRAIVAIHMGREASSELIKYLDARGAELDELVQRFCEMVEHHEFKFPIVCFYETQRTDFSKVVKELPIEFVKCLNSDSTGILVERHSACLQGPRRIGLDVRHAMLNKYAGPEDDAFVRVSFRVKQFVGGAQEILQAKTPASRKKRPRSTVPFDKDKKKLKKKAIDENGQKDAAQNSSQTVDQYLESIALPSAFIPEIGAPQRQATVSRLLNIRSSLDWFFDSPEFEAWISGKSSFLWCSGIPKSGKTVLSCYLKNYLSDREAHMRGREIISIFCTSVKEQMGTIEIDRILGYIASRLLRNDKNRLQNVSQQRPPQDWLPARIPLSFEGNFLQSLWGLVWDSMTASSNREVVLLLDGVNEIGPEEAREAFLSNIVTYFNRAKSEIHITLKVFVTSLPFEDVQKAFKDLPSIEKDKERQACLRTLHFEEYNARQNRVLTAEEKTGDWILSHSKFKEWDESSDSGLLWIHGKPGSGKSTLVKRIVAWKSNESTKLVQTKSRNISHSHPEKARTLEEADTEYVDQLATDRDIIIAAFFYSFRGGKTETSHTLMLRSLLYQILKGNSKLFPSFQSAYRELSKAKGSPEWSYESLKSVFNSLRRGQTQLSIYIAVDAMDESETARKPEILDFLSDLRSSKSPCVFKVLIASRPHPDIQIRLKGCGYIILQNENLPDIKTVVIKGLYGLSKKHEISEGTFDRVQNDLIERCEGVFLWVSLVLRELEELVPDGFSEVEITTLLKSLPSDLVEFYKRIVKRLKENCKGQICGGKKMLAWAAFAERPMTTDEFGDAVIIPSDPEPFPPSDSFISQSRISHFERRIARNCGGLLEIRPGNIVQLLHQTTRDFILDKSRAAEPFDTDQLRGDTEIAIVCLRYLGLILQSGGDREQNEMQEIQNFVKELSDRPLLDYTLACLPKHFHHLRQNYGVPKIVNDELTRLIETLQKSPQSQAYNLLGRWCEKDLGCPIELKIDIEFAKQARNAMLVTAAREGHLSVVISLLRAHAEINGLSSGLSPLGEAASKGYVAVVQLLLEKGAAVNTIDKYARMALHRAAKSGHGTVVRLLLEKRAAVDPKDKDGKMALHWAAERGHLEVVERLLAAGADVNATAADGDRRTALQAAAGEGHETIVERLLAAGADVNASAAYFNRRTVLQAAAGGGYKTIVERLLAAGAYINANAADLSRRTALQAAAGRGYEIIVERLLAAGADVNAAAAGWEGRTALQAAAGGGYETIVERLLAAGGYVNASAVDLGGRTALQAAAGGGYETVVKRLLAAGADVNASAAYRNGRTALQAAAGRGYETVVERLLAVGADVNAAAADYDRRTALQAAAGRGHKTVVERLLAASADVNANARDYYRQTALQAAAEGGYETVVERLLAAGADVNAPTADRDGWTALQAAAGGGYETIVERLLEAGAYINANAADLSGRTALQAAAGRGYETVVKRLLAAGADVNALAAGWEGRTALQAAAGGGYETTVETLLAAGAYVNGYYGQTALRAAAEGGYKTVVERLEKARESRTSSR